MIVNVNSNSDNASFVIVPAVPAKVITIEYTPTDAHKLDGASLRMLIPSGGFCIVVCTYPDEAIRQCVNAYMWCLGLRPG